MLNEVAFHESPETNVTAPKPFMYDAIATILFEHALSNFKTTLSRVVFSHPHNIWVNV